MNVEFEDDFPIYEYEREAKLAQAKVIGDRNALSLLFGLNKETFIPKEVIESHIEGYEDLMAVLNVVQAGWGKAERDGVRITDMGKRISSLMFKQVSDQTLQATK